MDTYTLGFIFNQDTSEVLLMHKNRPEFQIGKLNGVGGRIESNENSADCIVREVLEETSKQTQRESWAYFGLIRGANWQVDLYTMLHFGNTDDFSTTTDEKIEWFKINDLPDNILEKLNWMIPMAMEKLKNNDFKNCSVEYV